MAPSMQDAMGHFSRATDGFAAPIARVPWLLQRGSGAAATPSVAATVAPGLGGAQVAYAGVTGPPPARVTATHHFGASGIFQYARQCPARCAGRPVAAGADADICGSGWYAILREMRATGSGAGECLIPDPWKLPGSDGIPP